jgi:hypothetical protein
MQYVNSSISCLDFYDYLDNLVKEYENKTEFNFIEISHIPNSWENPDLYSQEKIKEKFSLVVVIFNFNDRISLNQILIN